MEPKLLVKFCLTVSLIASVGGAFAQQSGRPQDEQTHFGAEVAIREPTKIPADVLSILREDKRNQTCLGDGESPASITGSWFIGSRIQLSANSDADLIVTAQNKCLLGANLVPFWVFRKTRETHELVLSTNALGLDVLNTRTNGYRDIRTGSATAESVRTVNFKFDGKEYRP